MPSFRTTLPVRIIQQSQESDEETWESDEEQATDLTIFQQIQNEYDDHQQVLNEYVKSLQTDCDLIKNRWMEYLDNEVFVILIDILERMIVKAKETNSLNYHKTPYNPMDFIAEQLWNLNPKHPERQETWVDLFNMPWVKQHIKIMPRPYFPFSWIWSKEYAALKIQAYMRGYWVRKRDDVQEMRQFWKALEQDKEELNEKRSVIPPWCPCKDKMEENTCYH